MLDARNQRLKRGIDLNMKHSELPKDMQELQTPFAFYLKDTLDVGLSRGRGLAAPASHVLVCLFVCAAVWAL